MKKIVTMLVIGVCTMSLVTGCGCSKKTENNNGGPKVNTNEDVIKDQTLEVFHFTNTSLIYENGSTKLETTVKNTSSETAYLKEFKIHVKDANGKDMEVLIGFIGDHLKAGESRVIDSYSIVDLTNAVSMEYEIVR